MGIGAGPNDHLVRGLARAGGGTAAFIFPGERIEPRVLAIFRQAIGARVSNLRIDWGGAAEQAPASPTLLLGEPMSAFARLGGRAAAPAAVTVSAEVDGKPVRWELPVTDAGSGRMPLPTLWARARIRDLEESQEAGGRGSRQQRPKGEAWKQEVISLATGVRPLVEPHELGRGGGARGEGPQTGELVLRKVPTLVTVGWHGIGSVQGARFGGRGDDAGALATRAARSLASADVDGEDSVACDPWRTSDEPSPRRRVLTADAAVTARNPRRTATPRRRIS